MAIYAAMLAGHERRARAYHAQMMKHLPEAMGRSEEGPEVFQALQYDVLVRFGRWDEILSQEPVAASDRGVFVTCTAMQHYARGVALAVRGDVAGAQKEAEALAVAREAPALEERSRHIVSAAKTVEVTCSELF